MISDTRWAIGPDTATRTSSPSEESIRRQPISVGARLPRDVPGGRRGGSWPQPVCRTTTAFFGASPSHVLPGTWRASRPGRGRRSAASGAGPVSQRRVSTVESRAPGQLGKAQPDDLIPLDDPEQAVTSSIGRRPERAEASVLVDVPLALRGTTVRVDIARVPVYIERLRRLVVEAQLAGRHCSRDQGGRNRLAVNDLDIRQALHRISLLPGSGPVRRQSVSLNRFVLLAAPTPAAMRSAFGGRVVIAASP